MPRPDNGFDRSDLVIGGHELLLLIDVLTFALRTHDNTILRP
jgi:hypothetical protein